jgi:spore coat polysaccharide biosynthesis protein SpsF
MIHLEADGDYGDYRWTVDAPEDLEVIRRIFAAFGGRDDFSWRDVLSLVRREPGLASINKAVPHKGHRSVD